MIPASDIKKFITTKLHEKAALLGEPQPDVTHDYDIMASGLLDSMEFLVMISEIEDKYFVEVNFSEADPESMSTVEGFLGSMKPIKAS